VPDHPVEGALYNDLHTLVVTRERIDWSVDRVELEKLGGAVLRSACAVAPSRRAALRGWLTARLEAAGGSAEAAWVAAGRDLEAVREVLTLARVRMALDYAEARAEADCPFWLPVEPDFAGVHAAQRRFVLHAESMGSAQILVTEGDASLGGHGLLRILPGVGLSDRLTLAMGVESGVSSTFPRDGDGRRALEAAFVGGVPLLLRVIDGTWRYDTDLAATFRAPERQLSDARWGGRVSQGVGVAALRIAGLQPYVLAWVGYEYLPGEEDLHVMRVGTRGGVDWDP